MSDPVSRPRRVKAADNREYVYLGKTFPWQAKLMVGVFLLATLSVPVLILLSDLGVIKR